VKQEKLPWLADNPFYTKRFAFFVGRRCRTATIRDVAREVHLDWKTVGIGNIAWVSALGPRSGVGKFPRGPVGGGGACAIRVKSPFS